MPNIILNSSELSRHINRQETNHKLQKDLLTFTFTVVIATIGASLMTTVDRILNAFIFLIPNFIIIPFQARITYYTMDAAHYYSFMEVFHHEEAQYDEACRKHVEEEVGITATGYKVVRFLVNHELMFLSIACSCVFLLKILQLYYGVRLFDWKALFAIIISIMPPIIVYWISNLVYPYKNVFENFKAKWEEQRDK